jgi:hypothetical protein
MTYAWQYTYVGQTEASGLYDLQIVNTIILVLTLHAVGISMGGLPAWPFKFKF